MKCLLLKGIKGCSLGGAIGSIPTTTYLGWPTLPSRWKVLMTCSCPSVLAPSRRSFLRSVRLCSLHDSALRLSVVRRLHIVLVFTPVMNPPGLAPLRRQPPGLSPPLRTLRHLLLESRLHPRELGTLKLLSLPVLVRGFGPIMIHPLQHTTVLSPPAGTFRRQLTPPGSEWKHYTRVMGMMSLTRLVSLWCIPPLAILML